MREFVSGRFLLKIHRWNTSNPAVNFLDYDISAEKGDIIQVTLYGTASNVLLLSEENFQNYRSGRDYTYFGGYYTRSPAVLTAPASGRWHVVVDLGGRAGQVTASVRVFRGP